MKKSILALLLAVLMVASLLPAAALADDEAVAITSDLTSLETGAYYVPDGGVTMAGTVSIYGKNIVLDLKGQTLVGATNMTLFKLENGATLTIKDSVGGGKVSTTGTAVYLYDGCTVDVAGGTVERSGNGNTITGTNRNGDAFVVKISGGTVSLVGATVNYPAISIGSASGTTGSNPGKFIMTSGSVLSNQGGVMVTCGGVDVSGGYIVADGIALFCSFVPADTGYSSSITGGVIETNSTDMYYPLLLNYGELTVGGTAQISGGSWAVVNNSGTITVNGNATIEPATDSGGAVYNQNDRNTTKMGTVTIDGGNINGYVAAAEGNEITVNGGKFTNSVAEFAAADLKYEVENADGTFTYYETFDDALEAADNGAVITGINEAAVETNYTLTIDPANGGTKTVLSLPAGTTYSLYTPNKSGYAFLGWSCSDGKTYAGTDTVTVNSNLTFTATWVRHPDTPYVPEPSEPVEPDVPSFPFYDVPTSAWYYSAVKYVYENKLMDGVDTYVFAPNDTLTRAMVWTIIARMSGVDTTGGNSWYAKAQEWVITNGISDGENPTAAITRQELVTMLYRYAQIKGYDVSVGESTNILSYVDATSISEYAMSAFQWACGSGLTEGDENGALTPLATATRAQAAAMIMRFCESVK